MTRDRDRACPVPGCPGTARAGHLLCSRHWGRLSRATKRRVHRTWDAVRAAMKAGDPAAPFRRTLPAYREAVDAALLEAELAEVALMEAALAEVAPSETEEVCHVL